MWTIWDKQSDINGGSAEEFLKNNQHLTNETTIFLKSIGGRVSQVEGKNILAAVYGVDASLNDDEFIATYEAALSGKANAEG